MNDIEITALKKAIAHLEGLECQSSTNTEIGKACVYLDEESGAQCAVGCLIAREAYNPEIEGESISNPKVRAAVRASIPGITSPEFWAWLGCLQEAHDDDYNWGPKGFTPTGEWQKKISHMKELLA